MDARRLSPWLGLGLFWSCTGLFLQAQEGLTPYHIARLRSVVEAAVSPDGRWIAYVTEIPRVPGREESGPPWRELHVYDRQQDLQRPYVHGKVRVESVTWRPNSKSISFLARRDEDAHTCLYEIPVDGGEAQRVTCLGSDIQAYSWSPDGKRLALIAVEPEEEQRRKEKEQGFDQEIYEEDWRPRRLYVQDLEEGSQPRPLELPGSAFELAWSPVDDRLAVTLAPRNLVDDSYMFKRVHLVDSRDGRILLRLENPGKLGQMAWSPDAAHLAMISAADLNDPAAGRLLVASTTDGTLRWILPDDEGHASHLAWQSPQILMYVYDRGVWTSLEKIHLDGSARKQLIRPGGPILTGFSLSRDGMHAAFTASSPTHPQELFTMSHGDPGPRRLTNSNPWLDEIPLASQEVVSFSARDGLPLEGILIRPLREEPGKRYPLVLVVHGGPESHHRNGWLTTYSSLGQMAAARGLAVFYTNYRGSTGRGVAFSKLSQGDPAGKEFDDLVDAVDHLIATGLVDGSRVGVTGGSYGGYATAWLSTYYSERFAAGVMFVGISNNLSKIGTTDIPEELYLVHALKRPWEDWTFFLERSPIYHAHRSRTPLLILHGKDDPRVNVGQSRELYRHLKLRGQAPVRLVLYPGEGHGNRKSAARLDYSLRALRWFEHYLLGAGGNPPAARLDYQLEPAEPQP